MAGLACKVVCVVDQGNRNRQLIRARDVTLL
jgi:hypothetical protein